MTDRALPGIKDFKDLQEVHLQFTAVTEEPLKALAKDMPKTRILH